MAGLGTAVISVVADTSGFEETLTNSVEKATNLVASRLGAGFIGAGFTAKIVQKFLPLEKEINKIFQINPDSFSDAAFKRVTERVLQLADDVGRPAEEIANSIGQAIGKGFSEDGAVEATRAAANLARATDSQLAPAIQAVTGAVNVYGEELYNAAKASDVIYKTAQFSKVPLDQLSSSLGNITSAGANAGISLEEVGATLATMTAGNLTASEATTQFRTLLDELNKSNSQGAQVFKAISGKTFPEFIKAGGNMQQALQLIQKASEQSGIPMNDLFSNINSGNAVMALTGENADRYADKLARISSTTTNVTDAADIAASGGIVGLGIALDEVRNSVQSLGLQMKPLGDEIIGLAIGGLQFLRDVIMRVSQGLSNVNWDNVVNALGVVKSAFSAVGELVMSVFDLLAGLDWASIGNAVLVFIYPLASIFKVVQVVATTLNEVLVAMTPAFQAIFNAIAPILPYVAVFILVFTKAQTALFLFQRVAGLVARAIGLIVAIVPRLISFVLRLRAVVMLAFATNPLTIWLAAFAALVTAFVIAWQKSETFREIVIKAINAVKNGVTTAVEFIIKALLAIPRAWADMADSVLAILEKLPDFLGGGKFSDARAGVQRIIRGLDAMENKVSQLGDTVRAVTFDFGELQRKMDAATASQRSWFTEGTDQTGMRIEDILAAQSAGSGGSPNLDALNELLFADSGGGGSSAADKAKQVTKRVKDMIEDIFKSVRDFAKDYGTASVDSIRNTFDSIIERYQGAIEYALEEGRKGTANMLKKSLKRFKSFEKQMVKLAKRRDVIFENLDSAEDQLKNLKSEAEQFGSSLVDSFVKLGSAATASAGIGVTFRGIRNNLKDAIRTTQQFDTAIRKLQKLNLNESTLRQLAEAGPAALDQAMALARSGASGIKEINALQAELEKMAGKNSKNLTDEFFEAGIQAANGLVKGLKSQKQAIIDEMEDIANAMVKAVKKGLKIQSPSRVFENEIGAQIPAGMAIGVRRGTPDVLRALNAMSTGGNTTFGPGAIQVNGVSDPAAARRAGILAGSAVVSVMERNADKARLAGVGN